MFMSYSFVFASVNVFLFCLRFVFWLPLSFQLRLLYFVCPHFESSAFLYHCYGHSFSASL